ncbi:MAG TPA: hypothetical protein VFO65_01475 [Acidimicrobiales bacterium]|nr:hypothetical protein [Acidimicrobiales bacterium]
MDRPPRRAVSRPAGLGFVGNSLAHLVIGAAGMAYAVVVPAVVLRRFGTAEYGTWYLAFQVAAYVLLLDLGSQYVVSNESATLAPGPRAARLTSAAMAVQSVLALAALGVAMAWATVTGQRRLVALVAVLGVAAVSSLLASTVRAWFAGLHRAHVPAAWLVGARVAAVAGLAWALVTDAGMVALTAAVALPQLAVHGAFLLLSRRPPSPWARPDRAAFERLARTSLPLAVWTVCGVLIAGVDIFVVRAVDPTEVGRFAVALPILAIPTGIVTAATSAWLPRVARYEAAAPEGGRHWTLLATSVAVAALAVGALPFMAFAPEVVHTWAGPGRWGASSTYLQLLYVASAIRFSFLPWSILVVARGQQSRITAAPVLEAAVNLSASLALGLWLGAAGVALGTLVGSVAAVATYLAWAVPRTAGSGVTSSGLIRAAGSAWPPVAAAGAAVAVSLAGAPGLGRAAAAAGGLGVAVWWAQGLRRRSVPAPAGADRP